MRILITDDHPIIRNGIRLILSELPEDYTVDEAENAKEAIQKVKLNDYELIILDISMPGGSGLDALNQIIKIKPQSKVLMLSVHDDEQYITRAIQEGAAGFLIKTSATEELEKALKNIIGGKKYFSPQVAEKIASIFDYNHKKAKHSSLSHREFQIFCLIAEGLTINEIAEELSISSKTVSTHYYRILDKMDMKKNSEIIHYAYKNNLIELP